MADWKQIIRAVAPTLGTALGGPLAGAAVSELSNVLLGKPDGTEDEVAAAVPSMTPENILAIKQADQAFAVRMRELDIDLAKLNAETEKAYLGDVQDARKVHAGDVGVFRLGMAVLGAFAGVMTAVLYGSFLLLTGGLSPKDASTVGLVSGLIGTVVGYAAANAQQVVAYFFGSSRGSAVKTDAMAAAVQNLGAKQ